MLNTFLFIMILYYITYYLFLLDTISYIYFYYMFFSFDHFLICYWKFPIETNSNEKSAVRLRDTFHSLHSMLSPARYIVS